MLTQEMIMVMGVIGAAVFLFIVEWVRVDVVAILVMLTLPLLGLVNAEIAFSGLSSNAVVSIIAVIIIGAGLDRTGIMNQVVKPITKLAGNSESRLIVLVSGTVAFISSFMQNIGAVALFLPATKRVSQQMGLSPSQILMPMGFLGIIGGCITLVGSSPLILLNDLLLPQKLEPFGLFDVTPINLALVAAALGYFVLFGKFVLPGKAHQGDQGLSAPPPHLASLPGELYELTIPREWHGEKTLDELAIRPNYLATVIAIARYGLKEKVLAPTRDEMIRPRDTIAVFGLRDDVQTCADELGWTLKPSLFTFRQDLAPDTSGLAEAIISPQSELAGISMRSIHFRKKFQVNPLAIKRQNRLYFAGLADMILQPGDFLVLYGSWERFRILKESQWLFFTSHIKDDSMRTDKAVPAVISFFIALGLVFSGLSSLSVALLTGATCMVLTGVLSMDEAYKAVDWRTVFLLAGLIPLGIAAETTGTATYIADGILHALGTLTPVALISVIAMLTSVFTLVISNVGATVLMVPLAINMAYSGGIDPRIAALTVAVAASNTFILPTHQVNAFIMGPGGYKTRDYLKAGGWMTILYLIVMVASISALFDLSVA